MQTAGIILLAARRRTIVRAKGEKEYRWNWGGGGCYRRGNVEESQESEDTKIESYTSEYQ